MLEADFLSSARWSDATCESLKGDCSTRRFTRLARAGRTAILMQAAPDQKTKAFLTIDALLRRAGLGAPEILAAEEDADGAFVLMEDFGPALFSDRIESGANPTPFDEISVEVLAHLHARLDGARLAGLGLTDFSSVYFADQVFWCVDHYAAPRAGGVDDESRAAFRAIWERVLAPLDALPRVLMLRDFIADNIVDRGGEGMARAGLIDFQDGGPGPLPYDLASWGEEVRRDFGGTRWAHMLDFYHDLNPVLARDVLEESARLLSAQRHVRLLGNLALQRTHGKLARIEAQVRRLLPDAALAPVRAWFFERGLLRDAG